MEGIKTPFQSVSHDVRSHVEAYQRIAWFMLECVEREHLVTLKALSAEVPAAGLAWMSAWLRFCLPSIAAEPVTHPRSQDEKCEMKPTLEERSSPSAHARSRAGTMPESVSQPIALEPA